VQHQKTVLGLKIAEWMQFNEQTIYCCFSAPLPKMLIFKLLVCGTALFVNAADVRLKLLLFVT